MVMNEITKEEEGGVGELLCADDLVLLGDGWEESKERNAQWKGEMTEKGLKVDVKGTTLFVLVREL